MIRIFADYSMMPTARNLSPEQLELPTKFFDAGLMIRTGFLQVSVPLFMNNGLQKTLGGIEVVGGPGGIKQYVLPTYKQQLQRGIRFSLNIPLNSGLFLRKSILSNIWSFFQSPWVQICCVAKIEITDLLSIILVRYVISWIVQLFGDLRV